MKHNKAIASQLRQIAALLDASTQLSTGDQAVRFKAAAYRRGAQVIEDLEKDLRDYPQEVKELKKIPGIGEAIARKIIEFHETGKIEALEKLRMEQGGLSAELMDIEGLGPKRVRQIQEELGITTVDELVKRARAGDLRKLQRFDERLEKQILEHAGRVEERMKRFERGKIESEVEELVKLIRLIRSVKKVEVAGSYRRQKETVGDLDILVVTNDPAATSDAIVALRPLKKLGTTAQGCNLVRDVIAHGDKKLSFDLQNGLRVDVRFVRADQWGSALLYFTGSKEHNIAMRKIAIKKGWKLNEYGLFDGDTVVASETEEEIYNALGLVPEDPSCRTGSVTLLK